MLTPELIAFLERGSSVAAALVGPGGEPFATRGWGIEVVATDPPRLRVLLPEGALASVGRRPGDGSPFALAVTAGDVRTLHSIQAKGTAHGLERATEADVERSMRFRQQFFDDVHATDGNPVELLARLAPADLVACTLDVTELFDQTPGPAAGSRLEARP